MFVTNQLKRTTLITMSMVLISLSIQSSPPVTSSRVQVGNVSRKRASDSIYRRHYEKNVAEPTFDLQNSYDATVSDAMELYSISAKRVIVVQEKPGSKSWDHEFELTVNQKQKVNGRENQFITETVSYGRLKIKSEHTKQYLCVKNDGGITFKDSADGGKNHRSRKRCLFNMSLTRHMHVKLSVETGKITWYLTVKDDVITMTESFRSNELERSFMWLPTKSASSIAASRLRNFDDKVSTVCDSSNKKIENQANKIRELQNQVMKLEDEIDKLRTAELRKKLISSKQKEKTS